MNLPDLENFRDYATRAAMPTLMIPDFHMSSVSQAQ